MRIAHLSDTHLGFQAYGATTDHGFNQREADVMRTFRDVLSSIEIRDPDMVVHSGDLFHRVRPSNATIVATFTALQQFQERRNGRPFVIVGGNHDTPRIADAGSILKLFTTIPGIHIATTRYEVIDMEALDAEVLAVPHEYHKREEKIELAPTGRRSHNVLVLHGIEASLQGEQAPEFDVAETRQERWSYVALGDWHSHKAYGKNISYAGSTDFTSSNIWEEARDQKGWVWFDDAVGTLEHVPVATRPIVDCRWIDSEKLEPKDVERQMQQNLASVSSERPLVRQVVTNAHPLLRSRIDQKVVRDLSARCLHYRLTFWPPRAVAESDADPRQTRTSRTLEQSWEEHLMTANIPKGMKRDGVKQLGRSLLEEVRDAAPESEA